MEYPEHEKLKAVQPQSQACGEFIEWLRQEKGIQLCVPGIEMLDEWHDSPDGHACRIVLTPVLKLLAEFFDIDENKLEEEKRAMLDAIRKGNEILAAGQGDENNG